MVQYTQARFDASFAALSDATRRGVLEKLARSDASITDLAETFHMTLTGMKKHVDVLERAGLVITEKVGRVRTCRLGLSRLEEEMAWIERYRQLWEDARFEALEMVIEDLKRRPMDETKVNDPIPAKNCTDVNRPSERELVITRTFDGPAHLVFEAWTKPELLMRWWAPKSFGICFLSCEADVRTGGTYRFVFGHPASDQPMAFFGRYIEVTPHARFAWTNEESEDGSVTTVTFAEKDGKTHLVVSDLYLSKDALDAAIASGSTGAFPEQFEELDTVLAALLAGTAR